MVTPNNEKNDDKINNEHNESRAVSFILRTSLRPRNLTFGCRFTTIKHICTISLKPKCEKNLFIVLRYVCFVVHFSSSIGRAVKDLQRFGLEHIQTRATPY